MTEFEYGKFFPYQKIREQQETAISFTLDAFLNKRKKFVVLELGTGCGKSAIGVTVTRFLNSIRQDEEQGEYQPGAYTITTQKILQEQYVKDFGPPLGMMKTIQSSANFRCKFFKNNTCAESMRLLKSEDRGTPFWNSCAFDCRYRRARDEFLKSSESVTNFSYFLASSNYASLIKPRDLLIIDEAHNTETELSKFVEILFSEKFARDVLKVEFPKIKTKKSALKWIRDVYSPKLKSHIKHINEMISKFKGLEERMVEFTNFAKQYEMLDKHICKVERFLEIYDDDNWVLNLIEPDGRSMHKFEFKPVDVSSYSHDNLFKYGKNVLLMSATIVNHDVFCDSVGISRDDVEFLSIDSPFPIENRPIIYSPAGSMTKDNIDDTLPKLVEMIKIILDEHKGEKGIIHAHTFKIANYIKQNIRGRRLIIHDSENREEIIKKHMTAGRDTVIISPSLSEGIDLKGDLSRFQIICKVPYPFLGDKIVKKRMLKNKSWYPYQTAKTIVQSVGRSIRNENDHAATYILDSNWGHFFNKNKALFPESFKKCIQ